MYTDMVIIDGPPRLKARMTSVKSERRKGQQYKKQQERVKRTVIEHAPNTKNYDNRATFQTPAESRAPYTTPRSSNIIILRIDVVELNSW